MSYQIADSHCRLLAGGRSIAGLTQVRQLTTLWLGVDQSGHGRRRFVENESLLLSSSIVMAHKRLTPRK